MYVATSLKMVFAVFPALLLLVSVCGGELLQEDQDQCPTWFVPHVYNGTSVCECGSSLDGEIICDQSSNLIKLETHFCMTYNESNDATITGRCPYNCMLQALSLEYVVAFYPLFLIITIYVCVQLHASDFKIFVYLWKPFRNCCRNWDSSETLIHAFAAFLLLSYSKILLTSLTLLKSTKHPLYNASGITVTPLAVYYDASFKYFGSEHLPFALLAILVLAIFTVLPVLILLLYPTRVFQRCLGCCNTRWQLALRTFVDAFQGCYKDGTAGTPDWRCFSGLYFICIATINVCSVIRDNFKPLITMHIGSWSLLFSLLRPYKKRWLNIFDSVGLALYCFGQYLQNNATIVGAAPIMYILAALPLLYIIIYLIYKLLSRMGLLRCCSNCMKLTTPQIPTRLSDCSDVPDRVDHPEEYERLLTATDNERQVDEDALSREEDIVPAFKSGVYQYGSV